MCAALFRKRVSKKMRRPQLSRPNSWKPFFKDLDWTGLSFPTSLKDIDTFEKNNPHINVNVWTMEEDNVHCERARLSTQKVIHGRTRVVNLLMLCAPGDDGGFLNHYTTILNIGKNFPPNWKDLQEVSVFDLHPHVQLTPASETTQ
jgi:hypothetical protein